MLYDRELDGNPPSGTMAPYRPPRSWFKILARVLVFLSLLLGGIFGGLLALDSLLTAYKSAARAAQCSNNLKQIALALHQYHEVYGSYPPRYVADAAGRPMHSWRVLLLPFLEQEALYREYDFREPWDGPKNIKLLARMPSLFACPSDQRRRDGRTNYVAIGGPETMFPGATSVKNSEVTDGLANTLTVVETTSLDVPWTAPVDLDVRTMSMRINDPDRPGMSSGHPGGAHVALGDGTVTTLKNAQPAKQLRTFTTIRAGDLNPAEDGSQSF